MNKQNYFLTVNGKNYFNRITSMLLGVSLAGGVGWGSVQLNSCTPAQVFNHAITVATLSFLTLPFTRCL